MAIAETHDDDEQYDSNEGDQGGDEQSACISGIVVETVSVEGVSAAVPLRAVTVVVAAISCTVLIQTVLVIPHTNITSNLLIQPSSLIEII